MIKLKYKFCSGASLDGVEYVDIDELRINHGLLVAGTWELFNISKDQKITYKI